MPEVNPTVLRSRLAGIQTFSQLVAFLRDDIGWPIEREDFEDLTFEYTPEELGIDAKNAAKIQEIRRLRPISPHQPWGIFFVKFEPKRLPVVALRRILGSVALKKRASANAADRTAWRLDDLLFLSSYGEGEERQISFAHFAAPKEGDDLPALKVLGWDNLDTLPHLDAVARALGQHLTWPADDADREAWRAKWRAAFTLGHREVITTSKELSLRLAELARAIHDRIVAALKVENDKGPLTKLMNAFRDALVHDLKAESFADMYAQTITYGLLSARITDPKRKTADDFAAHLRTSPFLRELMEHFLRVGGRRGKAGGPGIDFDELGVADVVELLDAANMEAVVQDFGDKNRKEDPVIHFYEHFLAAYNKKLKVQRGVFYTPQPVVSYIVRSVHELLQTEFGLADGLADTTTWGELIERHPGLKLPPLTDEPGEARTISPEEPFVQILDPATGTATFLVEVIDVIHRTLLAKWQQQGLTEAQQLEEWNAYVPDHLLPRLHAYELMMAPYAIAHMKVSLKLAETRYRFASSQRARIYLTNTLEPSQRQLKLPEIGALAHEAEAVNEIKRTARFTVILGNPPYSLRGRLNRNRFILELLKAYKVGLSERKLNLDDDYLKFLRFSQWEIELSTCGLVALITNSSYSTGPTHRQVRASLLKTFSAASFLDLGGNLRALARQDNGARDENVFDIQTGVGVSILCAKWPKLPVWRLRCAELRGSREEKYEWLLRHSSHDTPFEAVATSPPEFKFSVSPREEEAATLNLVSVERLFPSGSSGVETQRDSVAVQFTAEEMWDTVEKLAESKVEKFREEFHVGADGRDWTLAGARRDVVDSGPSRKRVVRLVYRPFDVRWTYMTGRTKGIIAYPRSEVSEQLGNGYNLALVVKRSGGSDQFSDTFVAAHPVDKNCLGGQSYMFPAPVQSPISDDNLGCRGIECQPRRRRPAITLGESPALETWLLPYVYAVLHSPTYRERFSAELRTGFPCVPQNCSPVLMAELVSLGRQLVALHLCSDELRWVQKPSYRGPRNPLVGRIIWSDEAVWLDGSASSQGAGVAAERGALAPVPEAVWRFRVGGYQVCEKWLKDRRGRRLLDADIEHYQRVVVAISETIRIMKEIDEVIELHGGWPEAFQSSETRLGDSDGGVDGLDMPYQPRNVEPRLEDRYVTCVPLVPLEVAAGAFGEGQAAFEGDEVEWVEVGGGRRLRAGMFVAQVVGKSMEPEIPDGAYCLFRAPVEGSRQGKTVLVELRDAVDPETGERYTVKRYESEKAEADAAWRHAKITLRPANPEFQPIELEVEDEERLRVVAELVEVLRPPEAETAVEDDRHAVASAERGESIQPGGPSGPAAGRGRSDGGEKAPGNLPLFDNPEESAGGRKISDVEPAEAMCAIRDLFESSEAREGLDRESAIRAVARALGFARTGKNIRDAIDSYLNAAARRGIVETRAGRLHLVARSIGDYDRNLLKDQFLASLAGYAWTDRNEAIRAFARWMGYARTGPSIDETARSLINGLLRESRLESGGREIRRAR